MKALVKSRAERGLWLEEIDEPEIGINDVLVRVRYTGCDFRSFRERRTYGALLYGPRRGRVDCRCRPHRPDGDPGRPARRRAACCRHRPQPVTPGAGTHDGRNARSNPNEMPLANVQKQLGMAEGFDVGLKMSGNPRALCDMLANMSHGGKIAILGIPAQEAAIDWRQVIFNGLTIKGIDGREMYETRYKMTVMLESGVDIAPVITHRFPYHEYQKGFEAMISGQTGKVVLDWTCFG